MSAYTEYETTLRWSKGDDNVYLWTCLAPVMRKVEKAGHRAYRVSKMGGDVVGWFYKIPLGDFRWAVTGRKRRVMSEEQREAAAGRLKRAREGKKRTKL